MKFYAWRSNSRPSSSPPSRGRGLKCTELVEAVLLVKVAPLAGAWIEILTHT